jgi:hypothetical protein
MKLSRRSFLKSGMAMAAVPFIPSLKQLPKKRLVTGSGEHIYEVHHDWLTPPENIMWGDTHGLAVDQHGQIYVAHTVNQSSVGSDAVLVFDRHGKFQRSWGAEFRNGAHGLDIRKEGTEEFLYHCDINRCLIVKTDLNGKVLWEKGVPKEPGVYNEKTPWKPTNVAFAPNGDFFVGDGYGSSYIHRYTKDGDYVSLVCGPGSEPGQVNCPHGLWVDSRGGTPKLAVADRGNRRIQYLTLEGKHIGFVKDGMRMPCHMHFNDRNEMLVPDLQSVVTILDKDNQVITQLCDGDPSKLRDAPRSSFIPGKFVHPHSAVWINHHGDIVVAEWVPIGRVTLLKRV